MVVSRHGDEPVARLLVLLVELVVEGEAVAVASSGLEMEVAGLE